MVIGAANPAAAAPPDPLKWLHSALLTVEDLPPGYESADEWSDLVRPGEPDPSICVDPIAVGSVVTRPGITAHTAFFGTKGGPLLYEILIAAGPAKARALVAEVAAAPRRCPVVQLGDLSLTVKRTGAPEVGERASAVLLETGTEPPIRTRLIVFAKGEVTAILMAVGVEDAGLRGMHTIALTAAGKLARAN
ncbi:hypothetical protein BJ973_003832 [Actinoplanes tereljensis]|uniref:Uncharacterized protein n=1 Tax=Paractinoplanes tereljensis TaxID=571912 RepID=A0A919NUS5_9ACTN|nr:hypothetical protein [Actinoplanes tereljensis]GIF25555.1 hypothetical protein Ate02nite_82850 [Actinoplanes tereljensis]